MRKLAIPLCILALASSAVAQPEGAPPEETPDAAAEEVPAEPSGGEGAEEAPPSEPGDTPAEPAGAEAADDAEAPTVDGGGEAADGQGPAEIDGTDAAGPDATAVPEGGEPPDEPQNPPDTAPVEAAIEAQPTESTAEPAAASVTSVASGEAAEEFTRGRGGLKGGINAGRWVGHGPARTINFGLALGGFLRHAMSPDVSVQAELFMTDKGTNIRGQIENTDEALLYLELPLLARYDYWLGETFSVYGAAGPAVAYLIDSKVVPEEDRSTFDLSGVVAGGIEFRAGDHDVAFELRFAQGLLNVIDDGRDATARNMNISLYSGISL